MKGEGLLRASAAAIAAALILMLVCAVWPRPPQLGLFLGLGLPLAAAGFVGFGLYVLRDLRKRRAL
jgi:hypothetical protein